MDNLEITVLKFGGTSVATLEAWQVIRSIVEGHLAEGSLPVVVCSALSGISDLLESLPGAAVRGEHKALLDRIRERHHALGADLEIADMTAVDKRLSRLERLAQGIHLIGSATPEIRARVCAQGELLSTTMGCAYLSSQGIDIAFQDARELLTTEPSLGRLDAGHYLNASCPYDFLESARSKIIDHKKRAVITQGFIARTPSGETALLGRGGSDTSASYLASMLGAVRIESWTSVPGMFTANPHEVASARLLLRLSYEEAQELATSGAKVLHPRSIEPLTKAAIPLHIRWTERPEQPGTIISSESGSGAPCVKAVSTKTGIQIVTMDSIKMWKQAGFLADVFAKFKRHGVSIDLVATSEMNVTVTLDRKAALVEDAVIDALLADLGELCTPSSFSSCAAISLVGSSIRSMVHTLAPALSAFEDKQIFLISQAG